MNLINKINNVKSRIKKTAASCGRGHESIHLVVVSKTKSAQMVEEAINAGAKDLGENYIQEADKKIKALSQYPVSWHFIGHLQKNKAKYAVKLFDLIHTVDKIKLALELDKHAKKTGKIQNILIQVNIGKETLKSGVDEKDAENLIKEISHLRNLSIKGLMAIPPYFDDPEKTRPYFKALFDLKTLINKKTIPNVFLSELSMGMTNDYTIAVEEGSTLVRVGTAIFGKRD